MPFPGEDVAEVADDLTAVVGDEMGGDHDRQGFRFRPVERHAFGPATLYLAGRAAGEGGDAASRVTRCGRHGSYTPYDREATT